MIIQGWWIHGINYNRDVNMEAGKDLSEMRQSQPLAVSCFVLLAHREHERGLLQYIIHTFDSNDRECIIKVLFEVVTIVDYLQWVDAWLYLDVQHSRVGDSTTNPGNMYACWSIGTKCIQNHCTHERYILLAVYMQYLYTTEILEKL